MYKCKECGTEYEIKPEYCDCGNDTFEIVVPREVSTPIPTPQPTIKPQQKRDNVDDSYNRLKDFDPISIIIFIICILLGVAVILFVGNPPKKAPQKTAVEQSQNLPSVDTFWNNSVPVAKVEPKPEQQVLYQPSQPQPNVIKITKPVQNQQPQIKIQPVKQQITKQQKQVQNPQPQKVTQSQQKVQTAANVQPKTNTNLSALTQRVQANANNSVAKAKTQTNTTPIKTQTTNTTAAPTLRTTQTTTQKAQIPVAPVVDTAKFKKELADYKINLRNTIGKKINFSNVVGDGNCTVSFKVNSSGQLTNRTFSQQSSNITLNDAVYSAVAATPRFNAPPSGYKNETLNLKVTFYNGNFDIVLY